MTSKTKEIITALIAAPLLVIAILGGFVLFLIYVPSSASPQAEIECSVSDKSPLCVLRSFLQPKGDRYDIETAVY